MKIYISPSDQDENPYSYVENGHRYNEMEVNEKIAEALEKALIRCDVDCVRNETHAISKAIAESNRIGAKYHICLHTNAASDSTVMGTRIYYGTGNTDGYQLAKAVFDELNPITPGDSSFVTNNSTWNEVLSTTATVCYCESGFHSSPKEAEWLVKHTTEVAEAICRGICKHMGVTYVTAEKPIEKPPEKRTLYAIQLGAYSVEANARKALADVRKSYPDAFLVTKEVST